MNNIIQFNLMEFYCKTEIRTLKEGLLKFDFSYLNSMPEKCVSEMAHKCEWCVFAYTNCDLCQIL